MRSSLTISPTIVTLQRVLILSTAAILIACGGGGGGGSTTGGEPAQATADPRSQKLIVNWEAESGTTYNLFWSTDAELDPENYASFSNSGMAADVQPPYTLSGLENNLSYFLYLETENSGYSERFSTRPMGGGVLGDVRAIERDADGNLYLGGNFDLVGYNSGGLIAFDRNTELPIHSPYVAGLVTAIEPDGSGGFYVAGRFNHADGQEVHNIIRLTPDMTVDASWNVEVDDLIYTIAVETDRLLIGGAFSSVNNFDRYGFAALGHDGDVLGFTADLGVAPDHEGVVVDIALTDDHIIVGGTFSVIAGEARENLAALLPTGAVDLTWQADTDGQVTRIERAGNRIYLAGGFENVGGANRIAAAALDFNANVLDFDPQITIGVVTAIAVIDDKVYLGGDFDGPSNYLLATDSSGNPIPIAAGEVDGQVTLIRELDGNVLISGIFKEIGGVSRVGMALLNDQGGLLEGLQTGTLAGFALHSSDDTLLIGSIATPSYKTSLSGNLAKLSKDGDVMEWQTGLNDQVFALELHNGTLYAGGQFTETHSGVARTRLAAFDPANGALKTDWTPQANDTVWAIVGRSGDIHLAGVFNDINGNAAAGLATLNANGQFVDRMPEVTGGVQNMVRDGAYLYIAGSLIQVDGTPRHRVAAVNSNNGELLPWNPDLTWSGAGNVIVNAIDVFSGKVYIGGRFDGADGETRINLAAYSTSGDVLDWSPDANDEVVSIMANASGVRVSGDFTLIGGENANQLVLVDNDEGDILAALDEGAFPPRADTMTEVDGGFCLAGNGNFIFGNQIGAGIGCVDDDLNWLW